MPLRTPRRRISPRTKRRYRAIKGFLQRALGTSSKLDTKTYSSIEVSVSDLNNKIIGIEEQLNKVSKHCRDLACLEHSLINASKNSLVQANRGVATKAEDYAKNFKDLETKILYEPSNSLCHKSGESGNDIKVNKKDGKNNMTSANHDVKYFQCDPQGELRKKSRDKNEFDLSQKHQRIKYKSITPIYSTRSFHSLVESTNKYYPKPGYSGHRIEKRHSRKEYTEPLILEDRRNRPLIKKDISLEKSYDDRHTKTKRTKRNYSEVDKEKEFIANLIKRQYKPVKLLGRRGSDFSQFSAPVCRDQEFTIREEIQEGSELCSCCFDECRKRKYRHARNSDLSDMRSVCDTRLYSSKKHRRYESRHYVDDYNNSAFYDIVPVKEKSSPKARKKIANDNMIAYQYCKEVPPSPRSHRPRLNLKVQHYSDYEDDQVHERHISRRNPPISQSRKKITTLVESDISSDSYPQRLKPEIMNNSITPELTHPQDVGTTSSLQYPNLVNEQNNLSKNDTTLNTQLTDSTADKTLCEIKDILQTFLIEIKKEPTHTEKSDVTSKIENKQLTQNQESIKTNANVIPNSGHSFNNYSVGQCGMPPFLPGFPNPCCYPIVPLCPMNCLQNGYIIASPSYTCNVCANNSKEPGCTAKESCQDKTKEFEESHSNNETQELIKEIYKFVSQKPKPYRLKEECGNENNTNKPEYQQNIFDKKLLTTRSVGGCTKAFKHDANVGTPNMKCYSKSCEAFGSRLTSDTYNATNVSYSDTIIEKLSLEATHSSSETDLSTEISEKKVKRGKFKKVLDSLKLFKKKKDVIEELSESESTVEVEINKRTPFKQQITNYALHGQEYFQPPPLTRQCCRSPPPDVFGHAYEANHGYPHHHQETSPNNFNHHKNYPHEYSISPHCNPNNYASTPPFPNYESRYDHMLPQVPLCLKEVEVKSIGTQSERKMSIFRKLTKNSQSHPQKQPLRPEPAPASGKQTFWEKLQEKAHKQNGNHPIDFSMKTQKQLAQGDMKLRNAMLKKMFYKRNPFSPRNLIVRTLLGKDKSSYGDPPKMYRPRMFL